MKKRSLKKVLLIAVLCAALLLVSCGAGVSVLMRRELASLLSIEKQDDFPMYVMEYTVDYALDKLLAQGGVTNEEDLVQFIIKQVSKGLPIPVSYEVPNLSSACSTFNAKTPDGKAIFGRNHDNNPTPALLVRTAAPGAYRSVSLVNLSFLSKLDEASMTGFGAKINCLAAPYFPMDGMNEKGLAVGVMQLDAPPTQQNTDRVDINTTMAIRILLDKAATTQEAVDLLAQYDMHAAANGCFQFQIADASGDSAIVSYNGTEPIVTRAQESYQTCTNYYLYEVDFPHVKKGEDRYAKMQEVLRENQGVLTADAGMDLLAQVKAPLKAADANGNQYATLWSCLYNQTDLTVTVVCGMQYGTQHLYAVNQPLKDSTKQAK